MPIFWRHDVVERSAESAARAMGGEIISGDPTVSWRGAAIDSRRISGREIFFALPGERVDGHDYLPQAVASGAATVVVHRDIEPVPRDDREVAWVRVEDTYQALHDLTRAVRVQVPERLVAITGSAGKTTTKEILAALLARKFRTERSPGNLNNLYGFPLSLLNIRDDCQWMVAEMGMSTPGELGQVSQLGRPDVAVFTNVRPVHLENFRHLRDIADAKAELLAGLAEDGLIVANAYDPEVMYIVESHRAEHPEGDVRYVLYGVDPGTEEEAPKASPDVWASRPRPLADDQPGSRFTLSAGNESVEIELPLHGLYNVENCVAAAACALTLGVPLAEIAEAVAELSPGRMRGEIHRLEGFTVIDDSYNSNPDAACKALTSARSLHAERYVAILGDMLELGSDSPAFHARVGEHAATLGFTLVVGVGPLTRDLVAAARQRGTATHWFADAGQAAEWISASSLEEVGPGDLLLVKGSRGVGLEVAVDALLAKGGGG